MENTNTTKIIIEGSIKYYVVSNTEEPNQIPNIDNIQITNISANEELGTLTIGRYEFVSESYIIEALYDAKVYSNIEAYLFIGDIQLILSNGICLNITKASHAINSDTMELTIVKSHIR